MEGCNLGHDEQRNKILGRFDVETNTAYIDTSLGPESPDPRRIFTCWHEVGGHGILQGQWLCRELARSHRFRYIITTEDSLDGRTRYELDRQANLFAAHAAAPRGSSRVCSGKRTRQRGLFDTSAQGAIV